MRKFKKKIIINGKEYSTNEAKKFLSNILKKNNINKENRCKIVDLLSKHESYKFNSIVIDDFFTIEIVLFNHEDVDRVNNYGENIHQKRSSLNRKAKEYISIFKEILDSEIIVSNVKKIINEKNNNLIKITDIEWDFDTFSFEVENGKITLDIWNFGDRTEYALELNTNDGNVYDCDFSVDFKILQFNLLKRLKDIKAVKSYLKI